jgi:hypothetical protein
MRLECTLDDAVEKRDGECDGSGGDVTVEFQLLLLLVSVAVAAAVAVAVAAAAAAAAATVEVPFRFPSHACEKTDQGVGDSDEDDSVLESRRLGKRGHVLAGVMHALQGGSKLVSEAAQ